MLKDQLFVEDAQLFYQLQLAEKLGLLMDAYLEGKLSKCFG